MENLNKTEVLFNLFNSIRGQQALNEAAKSVRAVQKTKLDDRLNTMLRNKTLWGDLKAASFSKEVAGERKNVMKLDSCFDRFGQGLQFAAGKDAKEEFSKIFLPAIKDVCGKSLQGAFELLQLKEQEAAAAAEENGEEFEFSEYPKFDATEKADQALAFELMGRLKGFGTTLYKTPKVKSGNAERVAACRVAAQDIFEEFFGG